MKHFLRKKKKRIGDILLYHVKSRTSILFKVSSLPNFRGIFYIHKLDKPKQNSSYRLTTVR